MAEIESGVFSGRNPLVYSTSDPLALFLVQAFIIVVFCRLIHIPLSYLRQPKVVSEVIGGVILGQTVMGRIPNFTDTIFPAVSLPNINLIANIGLVFLLFIIGMEVDLPYLRKHWKIAASVGVGSILLPFGLGWAIAVGLYHNYHDEVGNWSFGVFGLFIAISISITALPVLARILIELGMLHETSGIVTLAAGVFNDLVAWILLALVISLAQKGAPIDTLYILLCIFGWTLLLAIVVRPLLYMFLKRTGSIEKGPSELAVAVVIMLLFVSAFLTDILGVHPIFGAFVMGVIIPRENRFPAKFTEKIEDVMSTVFMPIYFAIAGFNVNLAALNDGVTWGYTILVIFVSFFGKIIGATIPAKILGLSNRYAIEVGILMSCKGLVELVVLLVGLQAGILSTRIYSMFVLMAIVTTVITTPLTIWWRKRMDSIEDKNAPSFLANYAGVPRGVDFKIPKLILAFDDSEALPSNMLFTQLIASPQQLVSVTRSKFASDKGHEFSEDLSTTNSRASHTTVNQDYLSTSANKDLFVSAVHMVELTDRTTDLIQAMASDFIPGDDDPVMKVLSTFTSINRIPFEGVMSIAPYSERPRIINSLSSSTSDLALVFWDDFNHEIIDNEQLLNKPIGSFTAREGGPRIQSNLALFSSLFTGAKFHVGAFIDRGFSRLYHSSAAQKPVKQVIIPFFGGNDDWLAFGIGLYFARNENIQVTVIVCQSEEDIAKESAYEQEVARLKEKSAEKQQRRENRQKKYTLGLKSAVDQILDASNSSSTRASINNDHNGDLGSQNAAAIFERVPASKFEVNEQDEIFENKERDALAKIAKPNTVWEAIADAYRRLSPDLQSKVSLTKFYKTGLSGEQVQRPVSYSEALVMYKLRPQDLVLLGRTAFGTDNGPRAADVNGAVEHMEASGFNNGVAPVPRRTNTSMSIGSTNSTKLSGFAHSTMFGSVTTELLTSRHLECSFMVCQAYQTRYQELSGNLSDAQDEEIEEADEEEYEQPSKGLEHVVEIGDTYSSSSN